MAKFMRVRFFWFLEVYIQFLISPRLGMVFQARKGMVMGSEQNVLILF